MSEVTIQQAFDLAIQYHQSGRLNEAESLYRQILAVDPRHTGTLHHLGLIAHQVGRNGIAVDLIRQAIALQPDLAAAHSNLGNALREMGQLDEAIAACRRAIALQPDFPAALSNLGIALYEKGQLDEAIAACRQVIALQPDYPEAHNNLGNAFASKGQLDEAIAAFRHTIALKPDHHAAHSNLGNALKDKNQLDDAIAAYRWALAIKPDYPEAHGNLGAALNDKGQFAEALAAHRQALALQPDSPVGHCNLGITLAKMGQLEEAIAACRQAITLKPDYPEAHKYLGHALFRKGQLDESIATHRQALILRPDDPEAHGYLGAALFVKGQFDEAISSCRRAITLKPGYPEAHNNLGNALASKGQLDEAIAAYRQAIVLQPDLAEAHSNLVFIMSYHPVLEASALTEEHRLWNQKHAEPLLEFIRPHGNERAPDRRLRIGYVSPDFRDHPVAYFLEGLLEHHDPAQVEVFCYSEVANPDSITARMRQLAGHWREIIGQTDVQVADLILADGIDILVDLAGHTANNRLPMFARKPAPVQATWLGYPNTTGLDTIDYRITDAFADPPGSTEHLHSEQLVRLPRTAWCFRPFEHSPPVSAPPASEAGHITFGCFNAMQKINEALLELWAEILHAVPDSRLLLKNKALVEASVRRRIEAALDEAGIGPDRLEMLGQVPDIAGHLANYSRVDISLDTFPYHGTTTTCEALWMGVPVVTLAGKTHVSRVGVSLLSNLGHPEWIAGNRDDYVRVAVNLAHDRPSLANLRATLRQKMMVSPLMDASGFAHDIEAAYRKMWRMWCEQPESNHARNDDPAGL